MQHARIPDFSQPTPVRRSHTRRISTADRCHALLNERPPGTDAAVALLPLAEAKWAQHVKARRALQADDTPAREARATAAWAGVVEVTDAIISARLPSSVDGLRALSVAITMNFENCLDCDSDPVHAALKQLVCGVMMALDEVPPAGFEKFPDRA